MAEEKRLICPICFATNGVADLCCVEENCAWWNDVEEACALLVVARLAVRMLNSSDMEGRT